MSAAPEKEKKEECVQVVIRCRPLSKKEKANNNRRIVEMNTKTGELEVMHPTNADEPSKKFTFDGVYDWTTEQANMYEGTARNIVNNVIEGYNGTVFAYGQTGTGKTFSMEGIISDDKMRGVIPRAFYQVFEHIEVSTDTEFLVRASFIEIYNEEVFDLLTENRAKLELKEHPDTGVYVKNLQWFVMKDVAECDKVLQNGKSHRQVGATSMNAESSRSHCIFTISIETSSKGPDGEAHIKAGKLNLVDLAGSERQSKTEAEGVRLKEATKINLSLSALGNVISALTSKKKNAHIPYRDSKLTRLLQSSLGGNTKTVMIAAIGPADYNFDETISTLRFANRAKSIKNKPKINEDPKDAMLREYQEEIAQLQMMLAAGGDLPEGFDLSKLGGGGGGGGGAGRLPPQKVVVEKVVVKRVEKGVSADKLKELEEQAAANRKNIESAHQKQREEIMALKKSLTATAEEAAAEAEKTKMEVAKKAEERKQMKAKLEEIQAKLLVGDELVDNAKKQKVLILKKEAELRQKAVDAERRKREVAEKEEMQLKLAEKYESQDKELLAKTKKLDKLRSKYQEIKQETADVLSENQREREELLETIRELRRHIQLKDMMIMNFVPPAVHGAVEKRAIWNDANDEWYLGELDTSTTVRRPGSAKPGMLRPTSEFSRIKAALGDANPRFRNENIITLELDMPERTTQDYNDLQMGAQNPEEMYAQEPHMQETFGYGQYAEPGQAYNDNPYADQMQYNQMGRY